MPIGLVWNQKILNNEIRGNWNFVFFTTTEFQNQKKEGFSIYLFKKDKFLTVF